MTPTGNGKFSGLFNGTIEVASGTVPPPYATITDGQLTDVKLERLGAVNLAD